MQKAEAERARNAKELATARETIDSQRVDSEKVTAALEALQAKHETDMATMRKEKAGLQREKNDLFNSNEGLKTELATRARGIRRIGSQQSGQMGLNELAQGESDEDEFVPDYTDSVRQSVRRKTGEGFPLHDSDIFGGDSPQNSPSQRDATPPINTDDPASLRASLAHAQRTLATLRTQLSKEKQSALALRRQLGNASATSDNWDESSEMSSPAQTPARAFRGSVRGSARGGRGSAARRGRGSAMRVPSRLGREVSGDESFEENENEDDEENAAMDDSFDVGVPGDRGSLFEHQFPSEQDSDATFESPVNNRHLSRMSADLDPMFAQDRGSDDEGSSQLSHDSPFARRTTMGEVFGQGSPASFNGRPVSGMFGASRDPTMETLRAVETAEVGTMTEWNGLSRSEHEAALAKAQAEHQAALANAQTEHQAALVKAQTEHQTALTAAQVDREAALTEVHAQHKAVLVELGQAHKSETDKAEVEHAAAIAAALAAAAAAHQSALAKANEKHDQALISLTQTHASAVADLKSSHAAQLETTTANLTTQHTSAVAGLKAEHTQSLASTRAAHESELTDVKAKHVSALAKQQAEHEAAVAGLGAEHERAVTQVKSEHASHVGKITAEGAAALAALAATHLAEQTSTTSTHEQAIAGLQTRHADAIEAADGSYKHELAELNSAHQADRAAHEAAVTQLRQQHSDELAKAQAEAETRISALGASHADEVAKLRSEHAAVLEAKTSEFETRLAEAAAAKDALLAEHNAAIDSLKSDHAAALTRVDQDHSAALVRHTAEHAAALADKEATHATALGALAAAHAAAIASTRDEHDKVLQAKQEEHDAVLKRKVDEHEESVRRWEIERAGMNDTNKDSAAALQQLNDEHASVLAKHDADAAAALEKTKTEHAQSLAARDDAHARAIEELQSGHAGALAAAAASHEAVIAGLREEHAGALSQLSAAQGQTGTEHAAELAARDEVAATQRSELEAAHASALAAQGTAHAQSISALEAEHEAKLAAVTKSHAEEVAALRNEHSTSSTKTAAEAAAALAALAAAHAATSDASKADLEAKLKANKADHHTELSALRKAHEAGLEKQAAAATHYLESRVKALQSDKDSALTAQAHQHENDMAALIKTHSNKLAEQLAQHEVEADKARESHAATLASQLAGHEGAISRLRDEQAETVADLVKTHNAALEDLIAKHEAELDQLRKQLKAARAAAAAATAAQALSATSMEDKALGNQRSLSELTMHAPNLIGAYATPTATPLLGSAFEATPSRRRAVAGNESGAETETETEGEFEDARETIGNPSPSPYNSSRATSCQTDYATADGHDTEPNSRAPSRSSARVPVPAWIPTKRNSINTFGRAETPDNQPIEVSAAAAGAFLAAGAPSERAISPAYEPFRPESVLSSFSQKTAEEDKPKPVEVQGSMGPPPPRKAKSALSARKSTASSKSAKFAAPPRPTSPPPADLLYRAQSPAFDESYGRHSGFLAPTSAARNGRSLRVQPSMASTVDQTSHSFQDKSLNAKVRDGYSRRQSGPSSISDISVHSVISRRMSLASSGGTSIDEEIPIRASGGSTDPVVLHAITQTMIGMFMWKYTRRTIGKGQSDRRHKRFFWLHPYTKTLYWSSSDPGAQSTNHSSAKSAFIEGVRQVRDDNIHPPGLNPNTIIVQTPLREIHITADTKDKHDMWYAAISYFVQKSGPTAPSTPAAGQSTKARSGSVGNTLTPRTMRKSNASSSGGFFSSLTPNKASTMYQQGSASESRLTPMGGATPRGSGSRSRTPHGTAGKRSGTAAEAFERATHFGSPKMHDSPVGLGHEESLEVINRSEIPSDHGHDEDDGYEGLENVRACCDGKHDVGSLSRSGHHHHNHNQAEEGPVRRKSRSSLGPIGSWGRSTTPTPQGSVKGKNGSSVSLLQPLAPRAMNSNSSLGRR